jgi:hypothetical protein
LLLATAPRLIPVPLKLDKLGKTRDQLRDPSRLIIGEPAVRDGNRTIRLPVDMRQNNAIGIQHPVPAGHRLYRPRLGKTALPPSPADGRAARRNGTPVEGRWGCAVSSPRWFQRHCSETTCRRRWLPMPSVSASSAHAACGPEAAWAGDDLDILAADNIIQILNHFRGTQLLSRPVANPIAFPTSGTSRARNPPNVPWRWQPPAATICS